jgi:hypothetical protein
VQQDRDGTTLRRWSRSRDLPVKFVSGDWDNEVDENAIESVTLTYDFFELVILRARGPFHGHFRSGRRKLRSWPRDSIHGSFPSPAAYWR